MFGFKDPRTLLVLEGWKKVFPAIECVGIFRHPNAVARSLENRSAMPREDALKLWYRYNSLLLARYREQRFPLLCFDDKEQALQGKIGLLAQELGLSAGAGESFYTPQLRTVADSGVRGLPWKVARLYKKLRSVSR